VSFEKIDPYPWFLNKTLDLVVNEQLVRTRIKSSEWADSWRPFLGRLYDLWTAQYPKRFLVAIAGPPGTGKSVLAEQLHFIVHAGLFHKDAHAAALPMDGFHFPNAVLATHTRKLPDGSEIPLMSVKGQPDTIDVARLRRYMQRLIDRPEYVSWPGYSRSAHDVVPAKFKVHQSVNLVFIEGNYLLVDRGPFHGLPAMFDLRIYVDAPAPKIITTLVDRHIRGGKTLEAAKDWVKRIDLPNARLAEAFKAVADVTIERDREDDITAVTWRGEKPATSDAPELADVVLPPLAHPPGHGPKSADSAVGFIPPKSGDTHVGHPSPQPGPQTPPAPSE
jgi:pantothenate kinase